MACCLVEDDLLKHVQVNPAIELMCDESTNISDCMVALLPVVRYLHISLKLIHISDGTANTTEKAIICYLDERNILVSSLTSFGSDGANVMIGRISGVTIQLKHHNPQMLSIHCTNLLSALGTSQATTEVPYLLQFQEILVSIYKFYH